MDRYSYWTGKYAELSAAGKGRAGYGYTDEALRTFPRYNVLKAILFEIERYRPEEFGTFDEAKHFFRLVAAQAENIFTRPPKGDLERKAMSEERETLSRFIDELTEDNLSTVEPLFYRRVLSAAESDSIWQTLRLRWDIVDGYWYPLAIRKPSGVEAFQDAYFGKEIGAMNLHSILRNHGVETVWEMREDSNNYELELSAFEPHYNGAEGFWCDSTFDWIIYASHESSISVGGWLLHEIQQVWVNWEDRIWTTPFFD
jgi:hypothetical protein